MDDEETSCPLCMEDLDVTDRNFRPCPCGYQVCLWCYHHIKENLNGQCPACRGPYEDAAITADPSEIAKLAVEKKQKDKQEKRQQRSKEGTDPRVKQPATLTREQLQNVRVIQRTLVYVVGLAPRIAKEEMLRRPEFFGQYGRIIKIAVNTAQTYSGSSTYGQSLSCYITYSSRDEALNAILATDGVLLDGRTLRAQFGTTKYCAHYIRHNTACANPECMFLHEIGEMADTYTKEEMVGNGNRFHNETHPATSQRAMAAHTANGGRPQLHVKFLPQAPQTLLDAFGVPNTAARNSKDQIRGGSGSAGASGSGSSGVPGQSTSGPSSAAHSVSPQSRPQLAPGQLAPGQTTPQAQAQAQAQLLQLLQNSGAGAAAFASEYRNQLSAASAAQGVPLSAPLSIHGDAPIHARGQVQGPQHGLWEATDSDMQPTIPGTANGKAAAIGPVGGGAAPGLAPGGSAKNGAGAIGSVTASAAGGAVSSQVLGFGTGGAHGGIGAIIGAGPQGAPGAPPGVDVSGSAARARGRMAPQEGARGVGGQGARTAQRPRLKVPLDEAARTLLTRLAAVDPLCFPATAAGVPHTALVRGGLKALECCAGSQSELERVLIARDGGGDAAAGARTAVRALVEGDAFWQCALQDMALDDPEAPDTSGRDPDSAELGPDSLLRWVLQAPAPEHNANGAAAAPGRGGAEDEWHRSFRALLPNVNVSFAPRTAPRPAGAEPPSSAHESVVALWQHGDSTDSAVAEEASGPGAPNAQAGESGAGGSKAGRWW